MQFLPVNISPEDFINAARCYKGIRYDPYHTVDGICADCAGFMMLTFRKVGLFLPDHWAGFSPSHDGTLERARILADILHENFTEVMLHKTQPGDLLRFNFDGEQGRHMAIKTSNKPAPHGSLIHSMNGRVTDDGGVFEQRIDPQLRRYMIRAYRLNRWCN